MLQTTSESPIGGSPDVHNESAYQYQLVAVPAASACSLISAIVIWFAFEPRPVPLLIALVLLSVICIAVRWRTLPRLTSSHQLDLTAGLVFGAAAIANMFGAYCIDENSAVSCGLLVVATVFAFHTGWAYGIFTFCSVVGQYATRHFSPYLVDFNYISLLILAPLYAVVVSYAVKSFKKHIDTAQQHLQQHVDTLRQERKLRVESEKQLIHAQKMEGLGLVAAGVAHDFNNHLQAIGTLAELILNGDDVEANAYQIRLSAENAAEICQHMLPYAGKSSHELVVLNVKELIAETEPALRIDLPPQVTLQFELPTDLAVYASRTGLRECFLNVVRNAMEACGEQGNVVVRLFHSQWTGHEEGWRTFGHGLPHGEYVFIEVADNGCGMTPDVLERAFDPYFTTKSSGHGFGLAAALGIMHASDGAVRVQTSEGGGTTVQLVFPIADSTQSPTDRVLPAPGNSTKGPPNPACR